MYPQTIQIFPSDPPDTKEKPHAEEAKNVKSVLTTSPKMPHTEEPVSVPLKTVWPHCQRAKPLHAVKLIDCSLKDTIGTVLFRLKKLSY